MSISGGWMNPTPPPCVCLGTPGQVHLGVEMEGGTSFPVPPCPVRPLTATAPGVRSAHIVVTHPLAG